MRIVDFQRNGYSFYTPIAEARKFREYNETCFLSLIYLLELRDNRDLAKPKLVEIMFRLNWI